MSNFSFTVAFLFAEWPFFTVVTNTSLKVFNFIFSTCSKASYLFLNAFAYACLKIRYIMDVFYHCLGIDWFSLSFFFNLMQFDITPRLSHPQLTLMYIFRFYIFSLVLTYSVLFLVSLNGLCKYTSYFDILRSKCLLFYN